MSFLQSSSRSQYSKEFYDNQRHLSLQSARQVIPLVLALIGPVKRVVDVGCGVGTWLAAFSELGITDVLGLDGAYVDSATLLIPAERFKVCDLTMPFALDEMFELVISLEVAEHLPAESAPEFVRALTRLGPVVLFSAAIPFQGGTGHINEQWPDYWIALFRKEGFQCIDWLRRRIWNNPQIQACYAQNTFIFVRGDCLAKYPLLENQFVDVNGPELWAVHPEIFLSIADPRKLSFRSTFSLLLEVCKRSVIKRSKTLLIKG